MATQVVELANNGTISVFIPNGWWHTAHSLTVTLSVALDSLNTSNWNRFKNEVTVRVDKKTNALVANMVGFYISLLGRILKRSKYNEIILRTKA